MYKRMLIPLDGTQLAELVIPYAKDLAGRLDLDMIILHVSTPEERGLTTMHKAYVERIAKKVKGKSIKVQQRMGSIHLINVKISRYLGFIRTKKFFD